MQRLNEGLDRGIAVAGDHAVVGTHRSSSSSGLRVQNPPTIVAFGSLREASQGDTLQ